eukprot:CCRYP_008598-RA/>CCRYP_008598-RA protein AED:0.02 eAED:0.02 QI:297/0.5/0.66/1/0.5/0.66/3/66/963
MAAIMAQNKKERRRRGKRNGGADFTKDLNGKHHSQNISQASQPAVEPRSVPASDKVISLNFKPHNTLLVQFTEQTPTWYDCGRNTPGRDDVISTLSGKSSKGNTREIISKYRQLADDIYAREVALSRSSQSQNSSSDQEKDEKWVENTMKRGTLKDRIAAMSVVVSMDCIHKLYALDMLLDLAGCGVTNGNNNSNAPNSRIGQMASEALADLFINTLLPKDRKLLSLEQRPLYQYEKKTLSPRILMLWRYEEMMKMRYASYIQRYLGRTLGGEDELSKRNALITASTLLKEIPEGEEVLLTLIVNKIGDPGKKIASAAGHQLRGVLEEHPVMVNVVAREIADSLKIQILPYCQVQQLAHRPHLSPRALYNCVIFLNQLQLSRDEEEEDSTAASKNTNPSKASSTTNVRVPSLPASLINTYFHLFETAVQKDQSNKKKGSKSNSSSMSNTDSSGMKSRLLSALLTGVNRAHPYLPRKDAAMEQHIDALYRISHTAPPAAATQALMLLFQLAVGSGEEAGHEEEGGRKQVLPAKKEEEDGITMRKDRFYRALYSKIGGGEMFSGRQLTLFFNLLYKAMKYDTSTERICAFSKRLLHTVLHQSSSIICGTLFLLSEIVKCHPEILRADSTTAEEALFDPSKREPRAAFGGKTTSLAGSLWELSLLVNHFHPSVSKFTSSTDGNISYAGDPLKDFGLAPFLDKFAFRNPKSVNKSKRGVEGIAGRKTLTAKSTGLPMNDPSFLEAENIPAEEKFFHQFFMERAKRDEIKGVIRGSGRSKDRDGEEDEALDAAEKVADEDFDWSDADSEEEAFATQLAERLMERGGNGKANFDDEDPDMDDWSDFGSDDDDVAEHVLERASDNDEDDIDGMNHEDAFMDADSSDADENQFVGGTNGDDSESDGFDGFEVLDGSDEDSSSDDDQARRAEITPDTKSSKGKKRKKAESSIYADAEEYEKLIEQRGSTKRK